MRHDKDVLDALLFEGKDLVTEECSCPINKVVERLGTIGRIILLGMMQQVVHRVLWIAGCLVDIMSLAWTETEFDDALIGLDYLLLGAAIEDDLRRLDSTDERRAIDTIVGNDGPVACRDACQLAPIFVERDIDMALEAMCLVPVGLSVTKKIEFHFLKKILIASAAFSSCMERLPFTRIVPPILPRVVPSSMRSCTLSKQRTFMGCCLA